MASKESLTRITGRGIERLEASARSRRYAEDPVLWAEEYMGLKGQVWSKMRDMLESVRDNYGTGVAAGHGVSKSYSAGLIACWWIDTHPLGETETFVATTAPSKAQVDAVWSYMRLFHNMSKQRYEAGLIDHPLPGYITSGAEVRWKLPNGDTIAQGRKPPDNKSDIAFQGRHATYLLFIGDEATGLSQAMLDAGDTIATGKHNKQLWLLNPTDPSCAAAKSWPCDEEGMEREGREGWNFIEIGMFDSPLVTKEPGIDLDKMEGISGPETIENWRRKCDGEDDPQWISRVLGKWPWGKSGSMVFTEADIVKGVNCVVRPDPNGVPEFGCDIARMGEDDSSVYSLERGEVWSTDPETGKPVEGTGVEGVRIRRRAVWSKAPLVGNNPENLGSATRIHNMAEEAGARVVKVDASGIGSGVVDGLHELNTGRYTVIEVFGGAASSDNRAYINARAELFFAVKAALAAGTLDLDGSDTDMLDQLRTVMFEYTERDQIKIESKESMKKRGVKSPDLADAVTYAFMDVSELVAGPLAGLHKGDKVLIDPFKMLQLEIDGAGMPG